MDVLNLRETAELIKRKNSNVSQDSIRGHKGAFHNQAPNCFLSGFIQDLLSDELRSQLFARGCFLERLGLNEDVL
jgi:hypothetical protein